jgi:hypothetical protein
MKKLRYIAGLMLLLGLVFYQPAAFAVKIYLQTGPDSPLTWTPLGGSMGNSCYGRQPYETTPYLDTGPGDANICVSIALATPGGFATAHGPVKISGNCKSPQCPSNVCYNEGGISAIFVQVGPISKDSNIRILFKQVPNPNDPTGASDEFDVKCTITPDL